MKALLCIDDDPVRYDKLVLPPGWVVLVTCRWEDYRFYRDRHLDNDLFPEFRIGGICLDHDMPFQNGQWFAHRVREDFHVPVFLVSMNTPGRAAMREILAEYEVPVLDTPVTDKGWQDRVFLGLEHGVVTLGR